VQVVETVTKWRKIEQKMCTEKQWKNCKQRNAIKILRNNLRKIMFLLK